MMNALFEQLDFHPRRKGHSTHLAIYEEMCAEKNAELRTYASARAKSFPYTLQIESAYLYETQIALNDYLRDAGDDDVYLEKAWTLYDQETHELIAEMSTRDGSFVVLSSSTAAEFEKWLFSALETLASRREARAIAKAIAEPQRSGKKAGL